jgi:hypothetical protein
MSYSYIKSVFPNFENSNKVYDETLYNSINTLYTNKESSIPIPENIESKKTGDFVLTKPTLLDNPKIEKMSNINVNTNGQSTLPFQYTQTPLQELSEISFNKHNEQNNLSYYNLPIKMPLFPTVPIQESLKEQQVTRKIEKFEDVKGKQTCSEPECDLYVKHILECNKCKSVAMKQLGIESDKVRNEEIMEVVSYIVFGLFILLLIDSLKSDKK